MAVAELTAHHTFSLRENRVEPPAPGEVQVRVEAVGCCGSDLHYFAEGRIGDTPALYPMVLGHEPVGTVLSAGAGVSGWHPGDRVALEAPLYCYHCEFCMTGRHNVCNHVRFMSSPTEPGFFRDRLNIPAINLLPLPATLGFNEATLFEPLSIILHSFRFGDPQAGETAVVIGAGPIGLTTIAALKLAGVRRVWSVDPVPHRRALAKEMGADVLIDPAQVDPVAEVKKDTNQRGTDMVYDCATREDSINQAIRMTRNAGRCVITGVPSDVRVPIEFHTLRNKEAYFYTVRRANHTAPRALAVLEEHGFRFAPMVTHRRPMDEVQGAFETLERYADGIGKVVLNPR